MGRSRYYFTEEQAPHFLTATVNRWLPVFTRPESVAIVLDSWRYLLENEGFRLYGYVILENHLHVRNWSISMTIPYAGVMSSNRNTGVTRALATIWERPG